MLSVKMVVCVRVDLEMSVGKVAAQVGHGVLGCYQHISKPTATKAWAEAKAHWDTFGDEKIVVVQIKDLSELHEMASLARHNKIPYSIVEDNVVAIGPAFDDDFIGITDKLHLY